jgi:signal transduction histidine kinase/CheY-like chemotaxis protein
VSSHRLTQIEYVVWVGMVDEYTRNTPATDLKQALPAILITQNLRYWLIVGWGFGLAFAVSWRAALVWSSVAALFGIVRAEIEQGLNRAGARRPATTLTLLATVNSLIWAVAPLMAWTTGHAWAQMIGISLLLSGALLVFTQYGQTLGQASVASAPYAAVAAWFALHLAQPGQFWPFTVCLMILGGAIAASVLYGRVHYDQVDRYQSKQARLIAELQEARDSANAANAAKSAFLAMISHELRTPMNGVLGAAQLLDNQELTLGQRRYVEMIRTSGDSLLTLLNDMLDFAKIEAGRVELEAIEVHLPDLLTRVGAAWSARAETKGLAYEIAIAPDTPAVIVGDPTRLSQIVHNLLSNATKFTDQGRVGLSVRAERLDERRARISVSVADTGLGIAPDDRARLFQPFSQLDSSSTRRFGGTGLGLAISHRLAAMIDGDLSVESAPGRGSTFTLDFTAEVAGWTPLATATTTGPDAAAVRPLRVLVAEDHAINRQLLQLWLAAEGHAFVCVEDGQAALDMCAGEAFDVILMDVNMPVMDGLTAVRRLRGETGANRGAAVVMLSASARAEDHEAGLRVGANAYLNKPIDFTALRRVLGQLAAGHEAGEQAAA